VTIEDEQHLLFRLARLENRMKKTELSPVAMPALHVNLGSENPVTRTLYCYTSDAMAKVSANAPSGELAVTLDGKTYSMTAPTYICVPLKKGNNTLNISSYGSYGDLLIEILEIKS